MTTDLPQDTTDLTISELKQFALNTLSDRVSACELCPELVCGRTKTVFGSGNPSAKIVCLGEAPGADEDKSGNPFVGRAGQLLTNILVACGLTREEVYICNILKCRPPDNRQPTDLEAKNCLPYLKGQLTIIKPSYIICFGTTASQRLLGLANNITSLRGRWHKYEGYKVLCTYHPAYLLRAGAPAKQAVWDDLQLLLKDLEDVTN